MKRGAWAWIIVWVVAVVAFFTARAYQRDRAEVMADRWTSVNSQTWIDDFIAGNPHLGLNIPDGRAIVRGEHGVYMPHAPGEGPIARTEVALSWPHDLVTVEMRDVRSFGQERPEFVKQVLDDFNAFSAALPPRSN